MDISIAAWNIIFPASIILILAIMVYAIYKNFGGNNDR
jgi:hypothetical protein